MINSIRKCKKCILCKNQKPLLDKISECNVMWVGLSAKKVSDVNETIPLCNNTNSGRIIESIENRLNYLGFYKTNLVKCLPLDENNKLRYPTTNEMYSCIDNLLLEIKELNPKIIFILGKKNYNFIQSYLKKNRINNKLIYIEHPSYIYVYKRKYINDYIDKVTELIKKEIQTIYWFLF